MVRLSMTIIHTGFQPTGYAPPRRSLTVSTIFVVVQKPLKRLEDLIANSVSTCLKPGENEKSSYWFFGAVEMRR